MGFSNTNDRVERLERKVESILNSVHSIKSDIEHIDKTVTKLSSSVVKKDAIEESFKKSTKYCMQYKLRWCTYDSYIQTERLL